MSTNKAFKFALEVQQMLQKNLDVASKKFASFPTGAFGLTPDEVKFSPEFIEAKNDYNKAHKELRSYNTIFLKEYKKEYRAWYDEQRAAKLYANANKNG